MRNLDRISFMLHSKSMKRVGNKRGAGFTVVELVIVVVVIAILATIVVVAYRSLTKDASEVALRTDLKNSSSQLTQNILNNKPLPVTADGLPKSKGTSYTYNRYSPTTFCLEARNTESSGKIFHITQDDQERDGACPAFIGVPSIVGPSSYSNKYDFFIELITGAHPDWGVPSENGSPIIEYRVAAVCGSSVKTFTLPSIAEGASRENPFYYNRTNGFIKAFLQHGMSGTDCGTSFCNSLSKLMVSARNSSGWGPVADFTVDPSSC